MKRFFGLSVGTLGYALAQFAQGRTPRTDVAPASAGAVPRQTIIVLPSSAAGESLYSDLEFLLRGRTVGELGPIQLARFFQWDVLPFDALSPSAEISAARMFALHTLLSPQASVVLTTPEALCQRILSRARFTKAPFELTVGASLSREHLVGALDSLGYVRASVVEELAQFAVRGAVVDFFPPGSDYPLRVELFGDVVESIRKFDAETQRSNPSAQLPRRDVGSVVVLPVSEVLFPGVDSNATLESGALPGREEWPRLLTALRERGVETGVPIRVLDSLQDVVEQGGTWPGMEHLQPLFGGELGSLWDYVSSDAQIIVCDETAVESAFDRMRDLLDEQSRRAHDEQRLVPPIETSYFDPDLALDDLRTRAKISFDQLNLIAFEDSEFRTGSAAEEDERVRIESASRIMLGDFARLAQKLKHSRQEELPFQPLADAMNKELEDSQRVILLMSHLPRAKRMRELLAPYGIECEEFDGSLAEWEVLEDERRHTRTRESRKVVHILHGFLNGSVRSLDERLSILVDHEIFPEISKRKPSRSTSSIRRFLGSTSQMKEDDFVVHIDHGVAIYRGLRKLVVEGKEGDFLTLEYAEGAKLFIPV
ncbi:MAG: hypothetical protein IT290_08060, partial [Deltaproteobacteria bacterium]|nr:hypothetical protein [Deltaproteobacteria bacterium]